MERLKSLKCQVIISRSRKLGLFLHQHTPDNCWCLLCLIDAVLPVLSAVQQCCQCLSKATVPTVSSLQFAYLSSVSRVQSDTMHRWVFLMIRRILFILCWQYDMKKTNICAFQLWMCPLDTTVVLMLMKGISADFHWPPLELMKSDSLGTPVF